MLIVPAVKRTLAGVNSTAPQRRRDVASAREKLIKLLREEIRGCCTGGEHRNALIEACAEVAERPRGTRCRRFTRGTAYPTAPSRKVMSVEQFGMPSAPPSLMRRRRLDVAEIPMACPKCGSDEPTSLGTVPSKQQPPYDDALTEFDWCDDEWHTQYDCVIHGNGLGSDCPRC